MLIIPFLKRTNDVIFIVKFDVDFYEIIGSAVLQDVTVGSPVYLTRNGRGCYAIIDIAEYEEYEKDKAALRLMCELEKGRQSGEENGWLSSDEVRARFEERLNG